MGERSLHITVAAIPEAEFGNLNILDHELRLTKASILYADRVKLCSMGAWVATSIYLMGHLPYNEKQQLELIIGFTSALAPNNPDIEKVLPELQKYSRLFNRSPLTLTRKERLKKSGLKKMLPEMWELLREALIKTTGTIGFDEFELAANRGLLEIHTFTSPLNEEGAKEYLSAVEEMLSSSDTPPMLDEQTSDLVRLALQEGKMTIGNRAARKSKQIGLVADLFDRLPVFDVKMDELLDLRDELRHPLIHFRAEMINLSNDIETAAWDEDFPSDVQETYQAKIEPALLEIEEKLKSSSFREFWSRRIVDKYNYIAGSVATSFVMGAAVAPVFGIATAIAAAGIFTEAGLADLEEKTEEIERNGLYFYYRMKKHVDQVK